jgi:hypothetical protein
MAGRVDLPPSQPRPSDRAVLLFKEAAEQEKVTAGLVQRLKTYLSETRRRPGVRFEG